MALIVIDPGHGGHDPGAVGSRSKEKDNVLKVALRLKELLESHGHRVVLTRFTDKYLTLSERARIANELGADYFISLHNNAAVNKSASGFETFIYNGNVSQKTKDFQRIVHSAIASKIGIRDRGMKRANFSVLRNTKMVALLIEYGFITNTEDENLLINKVNNLAQWTCDGIINAIDGKAKESEVSEPKVQPKPKPKKKPSGNVNIRKFQEWLNKQYNAGLVVDGIYGPRTKKAAIKGLQTELNKQFGARLKVDGIWGPKTRNAVVTVRTGAKGNITKLIQGMLYCKGYNPKYLDGIFGRATADSVLAFQRDHGLAQDAIVGKRTFEKLFA